MAVDEERHQPKAIDVERHQAELIEAFSTKAGDASSPQELEEIVRALTSDSCFIAFPRLLSLPIFELVGAHYALSLDVLRLFAYGAWSDYSDNSANFPDLAPKQEWKLKQLTLLTLARLCKKLTYNRLKKLLGFSSIKDLEVFLESCNNLSIIKGNLNKEHECFEVLYAADRLQTTSVKVLVHKSFDLFLEEEKANLKETSSRGTNLVENGIVKQVWLPKDKDGTTCCKAEWQPRANCLFLSLVRHMTDAHAVGKSFGGQIYAGMFATAGEQLLLRPECGAQKPLTPTNLAKDRKAVAAMMRKNTGLEIEHKDRDGNLKKVLYPLYMDSLLDHLECDINNIPQLRKVHRQNPISMSMDENYIIFLLCHPAFLTHAARSVLLWFVQMYYGSSNRKSDFDAAMQNIKIKANWYNCLKNHWLFQKIFKSAKNSYRNNSTDCIRLIRDWEIHVQKFLNEDEKLLYTAAVINYLVEHYFDDFLPQAMYQMLCTYSAVDNKFDLKDWVKRLQKLPEKDTTILMMDWNQLDHHCFSSTDTASQRQINRIMIGLEAVRQNVNEPSDSRSLAKWRLLNVLRDTNQISYYKVLIDNFKEYAPIVYTPTVRTVCQISCAKFRSPWGMYLSAEDQGNMVSILHSLATDEVDIVVVTDGSKEGIDDLGVKSIGITIGKLDLYVAAAGINPVKVLPVMIDMGTDCAELLEDPLYHGMRKHRLNEHEHLVVFDEFMCAVFDRWPKVIVQFEGFQNKLAFQYLKRYRMSYRAFNDDIQGTAGVIIAGLFGAVRAQGKQISDFSQLRIAVTGLDSDGVAILDAIMFTMARVSGSHENSRNPFWIVDDHGLLTENRTNIDQGARPFARKKRELLHPLCEGACIVDVVKIVKPDILLLLSDVAGWSSQEVFDVIKDSPSSRPVIFAMSNSQCSAEETFKALGEKVAYASNDQLPNVDLGNRKIGYSNHINSIYFCPGLVLGSLLSGARLISDDMLFAAAKCLASLVEEEDVRSGILYPPISSIRDVTQKVAAAVLKEAVDNDLADGFGTIDVAGLRKMNMKQTIRYVAKKMWVPSYPT